MTTRVQIPAWTDLWMRGARYGTVIARKGSAILVKLDRLPLFPKWFNEADCTPA